MGTSQRSIAVMALLLMVALPAAAGKVGFVEAERAVSTVQQGQAVLRQLEEWAKPREERIEGIRNEITELRNQILRQESVASQEAVRRLQEDELAARRRLEDESRRMQREFEAKRDELLGPVAARFKQIVSEYAEANGFDAVFIFKELTVIYLSDSADITDEVIEIFDQRYKAE